MDAFLKAFGECKSPNWDPLYKWFRGDDESHYVCDIVTILTFIEPELQKYENDASFTMIIGKMYFGIEQYDKALKLLNKAVDLGDRYSHHTLGLMYEMGYGVQKDIERAVEHYEKSNMKLSHLYLCDLVIHGKTNYISKNEAIVWLIELYDIMPEKDKCEWERLCKNLNLKTLAPFILDLQNRVTEAEFAPNGVGAYAAKLSYARKAGVKIRRASV